uniref:Uncharacterized protein n=1 Tax=Zea mays TaxID=4577 RepID=C4J4V8_MAIZE|nr:unknown [Zea mays]
MTESMLVEFLHDVMKHATSRSVIVFRPIISVKVCLGKASGLSILLPITSNGIPVKDGLLKRSWSSPFAMAMFSRSAASTTYTIAETARQYLSHMLRNLGWPPISHNFIVTFPLVTFLILNPTVGIISSLKPPVAMEFTSDVFPAFWSPTNESSISCLKKRLRSQLRKNSQNPMAPGPSRLLGASQSGGRRRRRRRGSSGAAMG